MLPMVMLSRGRIWLFNICEMDISLISECVRSMLLIRVIIIRTIQM